MSGRPGTAGPAPLRLGPIDRTRSAKPGGGTRRLIRLSAGDDRAFAGAVGRLAPWIERARGPNTFAHGIERIERGAIELTPWVAARDRWRRAVDEHRRYAGSVAVTDVRDCYASIGPVAVTTRLAALGAPRDAIDTVGAWLHAMQDDGVRGLPVGPCASAVLAEAVLTAGDLALDALGVRYARWVDDVAIFCGDRRSAAAALDALARTWASLGLESHEGKTAILDPGSAAIRSSATSPSGAQPLR